MNTEHTPGPWHVDYTQGIVTKDGAPIAYVYNDYSDTPLPDACLIAAAPDLLAALKAMVSAYAGQVQNDGSYAVIDVSARDAIAKAEGKA